MTALVKLPRLNMLAVDFAASLFKLTTGDVDVDAEGAEVAYSFRVVDVEKFGRKLQTFKKRADEALPRMYNFLGGHFVSGSCGVNQVQDLAAKAAGDPEGLMRHLSAVREVVEEDGVVVEWGIAPLVKSLSPLLESVEFMEGVRSWPVAQLNVKGSGSRAKVEAGLRRTVRPSCLVVGALALGVAATYVAGSQRRGVLRFLIPLTPVEYRIDVGDAVGGLVNKLGALEACDLPEPFMRLLVASLAGKPAVFRLVDIAYTGGKNVERGSSKELVIDTRAFGRGRPFKFLRALRRHADALHWLARQWCSCERRGWPRECGAVALAGFSGTVAQAIVLELLGAGELHGVSVG